MLGNLFKEKKVETIDVKSETAGMAFETGKEVQFKDPKTGEFVYQRALTAEQRKSLMDAMQENAACANKFMMACRQRVAIEEQIASINKEITASEKRINDSITKVRDDLKLDRRWGLNMQLGVLERRDPPTG